MSISRIPTVSRPPFIYGTCVIAVQSGLEPLCLHTCSHPCTRDRIWKLVSSITYPALLDPMCLYSVIGHCRSTGFLDRKETRSTQEHRGDKACVLDAPLHASLLSTLVHQVLHCCDRKCKVHLPLVSVSHIG